MTAAFIHTLQFILVYCFLTGKHIQYLKFYLCPVREVSKVQLSTHFCYKGLNKN